MLSDHAQSLVAKAQAGDQAAFDALIAGHREGLQNLIRTRLVSSGLQNSVGEDDVYQETLLRAFQKLTAFRWQREDSFGRWLGVIATNLIRSAGKQDKRSPLPLIHDDVDANDDVTPSISMRRDERFDRLQQALDSLDPDSRKVLVLVRIKGLPIKEVARQLDRSVNATSILLYRAAVKLKESFGDTESLSLPWRQLEDRGVEHDP